MKKLFSLSLVRQATPEPQDPTMKKKRLMVCRPANAEQAILTARTIARRQKEGTLSPDKAVAAFQRMLAEQDYTFAGYLAANGKTIEDESGKPIGSIKAGDSFCEIETRTHVQGVHLDDGDETIEA